MPSIKDFFDVNSIWFFALAAVVWFGACGIMMFSLRNPHRSSDFSSLKANLGLFVMFIALSGGLIYFFFGRTPVSAGA